jgi:hypothetical protein
MTIAASYRLHLHVFSSFYSHEATADNSLATMHFPYNIRLLALAERRNVFYQLLILNHMWAHQDSIVHWNISLMITNQ